MNFPWLDRSCFRAFNLIFVLLLSNIWYSYTSSYNRDKDEENLIKITRAEQEDIWEKGTYGVDELKDQKFTDDDNGRKLTCMCNSVTKMQGFNGFSLEELRFIDYRNHYDK